MQSQGFAVPQDQQLRFRKATPKAGTKFVQNPNARALRPAEPGLLKDPNLRFAFGRWQPKLLVAFRLLLLIRFCSAMYTGISDCDEVFNYWEPLHYLVTGKGFQTWEYSPLYAIRSYFYLLVHSGPAALLRAVGFPDKRVIFFGNRILLATFSSFVEATFYRACAVHLSSHVGRYVLWIQMSSAALYTASASFLPSTFAMYFVMLGAAASLSPVEGGWKRISFATLSFAIAGIVGWPFAVVLGVPLVLEQLFVRGTQQKVPAGQTALWASKRARNFGIALVLGASVVVPVVLVDSAAYQKLAIVPLNIIKYNIFPAPGAGPELYGTEPWYFYLLNGLLSFNILFPLALVAPFLVFVTLRVDKKRFGDARDIAPGQTHPAASLAIRLIPFHLYLAVLILQKHKEERFLYPAYAHIILNAAVGLYLVRGWVEAAFLKVTQSPYRATRTGLFSHFTRFVIVVSLLFSFARITALYKYYHAPMSVYHHFQNYELPRLALVANPALAPALDPALPAGEFKEALDKDRALPLDDLVPLHLRLCVGKEWHRFPSSWLVPDEVETRWIRSAFDGILPKVWEEPGPGKGLFGRATATVPEGMNMFNREEKDRYVDVSTCDYLVDLDYPSRPASSFSDLEPRYAADASSWDRAFCAPFLDAQNSPRLSRALNLPLPGWADGNAWGEYCLLRRKGLFEETRNRA
ncbi:dolichyl-P-Man:Man(6)GlcNAc(2)-PP-dolichol alpha-1,2-mannosyltransferase [Rhodotorula paludigena]|uniref:dolichyl-P-Man:Man(6)GlcNAc(2)-PP-dolichol alpha-1,2-mannosyltransferase n=1 Tax=Rhodotorula paludigena TaxID=86838 RepID=UPI0031757B8D